MIFRSERGSALVVVFCAIAGILAIIAVVGLRVDRTIETRRREEARTAALWLARTAATHPGTRDAQIGRLHLHVVTHGASADATAEGYGTAHVDSTSERWTSN